MISAKRALLTLAVCLCLVTVPTVNSVARAGESRVAAQPLLFIEDNDFRGPAGSDIQSTLPFLSHRDIHVLGFTVVTGDDWENAEAAALLRFLEVAGRSDVPVVHGAVYPLVNSVAEWRLREQQYGFIPWKGAWGGRGSMENVPSVEPPIPNMPQGAPTTAASPEIAASFLIRQVHAHPHQVTIVATGPLTNLALAIRLDPSFASNAKQLIFMGGLIDQNVAEVSGNAALAVDFNLTFDPEAAHIVLTSDWPKIIGVGNVAGDVLFTRAIMDRIAAKRTAVTQFLNTYFFELPMWDEITAAIATDPTLITQSIQVNMDVDLAKGMNYGRAHIWSDALAPKGMSTGKVTLVQKIDQTRFIDEFVRDAQALP